MTRFASTRLLLVLPALALGFGTALAQSSGGSSGSGYFMPPQHSAKPAMAEHPAREQHPVAPGPQGIQPGQQAVPQEKLPPIPELPALPKEAAPPAPVIGVISVPEIMQQSTAARGVEKIILERRQALGKEAKADQKKWEGEQKTIDAEKGKLSKAALADKEKALQAEIEKAQVDFHNRNIAIEISARTALGKIEATLIAVIRQVAQAHGMNLVLHRSQVALNVKDFDISKEVADHLNKILPSVAVPPSVVPKLPGDKK
ncbi:MAG TPA: OmpH family outer membrane protein [Acidiphilium sp.]